MCVCVCVCCVRIYGFMITNIILSFHLFILHYDLCPNLHSIPSFPLLPFPKSSIPWFLGVVSLSPTKYRSKPPDKRATSNRTRSEPEAFLSPLLSDISYPFFSSLLLSRLLSLFSFFFLLSCPELSLSLFLCHFCLCTT